MKSGQELLYTSSLNKPSSQEGLNAGERRAQLRALLHGINAKIGMRDPNWWDVAAEIVNEEIEALARHPSFNDAIEAAWQPIETAPRDGTHILVYRLPVGIRFTNNTNPPTVAHWFDDGFYTSVNERAPDHPFEATHWQPLPKPPSLKLPDYRGGEKNDSTKTAESEHSPSTLNTRTE